MGKKLFKRSAALVLMLMVLSTGLVANAEGTYTVERGDYLKKIAQSVYGDSARWEDIYEANKASIKNPNILYKGQVLVLPDINPVPAENPGETAPVENPGETVQPEVPEQIGAADTATALEKWIAVEGKDIEAYVNELMGPWGLSIVVQADGNMIVFRYVFSQEIWGDYTAEELAASVDGTDLNAYTEAMSGTWEEIRQELAAIYSIQLEGYRFVFTAPDGTPFYSAESRF